MAENSPNTWSKLEEGFFRNVDQKLLERLRAQAATEEKAAAIQRVTGLDSDKLCQAIAQQNISVETLAALRLVPLVAVAWADDRLEENERFRLLQAAEKSGLATTDPAYDLLKSWMATRPPVELFETWVQYAQSLARSLDGESRANLQMTLLAQTRSIATACGGLFGLGSISPSEQKVIDQVEAALA